MELSVDSGPGRTYILVNHVCELLEVVGEHTGQLARLQIIS